MGDISSIMGGPWSPPAADPPEQQLREAIERAGLAPPETITLDGKIHRFRTGTKGRAAGDKTGWYVAYSDGVPAGRFGCWREGTEHGWVANVGRELTTAEQMAHTRRMAEARVARDAERERGQEVAADTVSSIWSQAGAASPDHPYLTRKGIYPHGSRITGDGRLIVPLYDERGELSSLQYISSDGEKRYHPGGKVGGCFWMIGNNDEPGPLYVAEGFATAATIYQETGRPCLVSYSAHNLPATTKAAKAMSDMVVIVADNDESGVGKSYADQASAKHGALVVMPPIPGDANDYAQEGYHLKELLEPTTGQALIDKLKIVFAHELSEAFDPPNEVVEELMTLGSMTVIYGDSNSGKTFFAISLAAAVASGNLCYGRKVDPGLVVYLASESPASVRARIQALKAYTGWDLSNLAIVQVPLNFHSGNGDASEVVEAIRELERAKGKPCHMVIGDTLARMSAGANENSGEDMGPVMERFEHIAHTTGAAMTIIHHNGKDTAKGARGWSGIRAHIDTEIEIVDKDGVRSASVTKQRELPSKGETIYFRLEIVEMGTGKFGNMVTTCVAVHDENAEKEQPHKKKDGKLDVNYKHFEKAWFHTGAEERDGMPYLSRSALKDYLMNQAGYAEKTARNKMEPSRNDGIIGPLLLGDILAQHEHGYIVTDLVRSSTMMMRKNGERKE